MNAESERQSGAANPAGGMGTPPPKRKPRNDFLDWLAWVCIRIVVGVLRLLPGPLARGFGRAIGWLVYTFFKRNRDRVLHHMTIAFRDEVTEEQKRIWCRQYFRHLGLSIVEFARMGSLKKEALDRTFDLSACSTFDELLAEGKGRGFLCVPAHHGNWELCGYVGALKGYPMKSVGRPLDNPRLNELVMKMREESGNEIIAKWNVLWKLKKCLQKGSLVTMSIDQNGGVAGLFSPLFGALASTVTSPADLYLAARVPIAVVTLNRQPDGIRHKLHIWDVIPYEPPGDRDRTAYRNSIIHRINAAYEKAIRAYPDQWLWVHRRWKSRPKGEQAGPDGLPPLHQQVEEADTQNGITEGEGGSSKIENSGQKMLG